MIQEQNEGRRRLEIGASALEAHLGSIEAFEALAAELGLEPGELALAWLLHQPAVTGPIVGPRTPEQLHSAIRALGVRLDGTVLQRLDEIFPGQKPAPEDHAW